MTAAVRTVLGDVEAGELGRTDYHEHLFQVSPLLPGDDLDDETMSGREAQLLRDAGIEAIIDATPVGLGRRPAAVARVSAATALAVVASTGAHRSAHYPDDHWLLSLGEGDLADRFTAEIVGGMAASDLDGGATGPVAGGPGGHPVRAGLVKTGVGYWSIPPFEGRVLAAAAETHRRTGAAVMVHLEHGSAAHEVLDRLDADGLPADRVILAHVDRNPDPGLHLELAARGAYLGYDGFARTRLWPDSVLLDCLARVVTGGGSERVLLGGDVARRGRYEAYGGLPGLAYLARRVLPRLSRQIGQDALDLLLTENPARVLVLRQTRAQTGN